MKCLFVSCFLLLIVGCGSPKPSNIVDNADQKALAEYEASLAEAAKMAEADTDFEE